LPAERVKRRGVFNHDSRVAQHLLAPALSENRVLGDARDAVVERAKQAASGTARAAREVARGASRLAGGGRE